MACHPGLSLEHKPLLGLLTICNIFIPACPFPSASSLSFTICWGNSSISTSLRAGRHFSQTSIGNSSSEFVPPPGVLIRVLNDVFQESTSKPMNFCLSGLIFWPLSQACSDTNHRSLAPVSTCWIILAARGVYSLFLLYQVQNILHLVMLGFTLVVGLVVTGLKKRR